MIPLRSAFLTLSVPLAASATHVAQPACEPAPVVVQRPGVAPNSTYTNDGEPPARFAHVPAATLHIRFGRKAIDELCGRPPCGFELEGCEDGDVIALPDPYKTDPETFVRILRHELGHRNGWPASHGD